MHIDYSEKEQTLVYDYFRDDLLSFVNVNTDISMKAIKQILWEVGLALKEFHEKNWIHIGRIL
jgi:serine/threonine protein kinase